MGLHFWNHPLKNEQDGVCVAASADLENGEQRWVKIFHEL